MSDNKIWRRTNEGYYNNKKQSQSGSKKKSEIKKLPKPNIFQQSSTKKLQKDMNINDSGIKKRVFSNNKLVLNNNNEITYSESQEQQQSDFIRENDYLFLMQRNKNYNNYRDMFKKGAKATIISNNKNNKDNKIDHNNKDNNINHNIKDNKFSHTTTLDHHLQKQNSDLKQQVQQLEQQLMRQKESNQQLNGLILILNQENTRLKDELRQLQSLRNSAGKGLQQQYQQQKQQQQQQHHHKQFITQTLSQTHKLKQMVKQLTLQNQQLTMNITSTQREQIKDRIIIKLEDQIITLKLLLKQQKELLFSKESKDKENKNKSVQNHNHRQYLLNSKYYHHDSKFSNHNTNQNQNEYRDQSQTTNTHPLKQHNYDPLSYR